MNLTPAITDFIAASPSSFHAAEQVASVLDRAGFTRQDETADWQAAGGNYLVRGGALMAWWVPAEADPRGFRIIGAHTDSPGFWLKPNPEFDAHGFHQIAVEIYGGPIINSFFDRELTVAGRVVLADGSQRLVDTGPIARIPNIAPHLDRNPTIDPQSSVQPISPEPIMDAVARAAQVDRRDIIAHDLITADAQPPALVDDAVLAGRLDNLSSVWAGLEAYLRAVDSEDAGDDVLVLAFFDHEEVGSGSATGAAGPILEDVLLRTARYLGKDERQMYAASSCVSADAAHSVHPNFPGKHDPTHRPLLGRGPVTKLNAKQRYASEAASVALWENAARAAGVPVQRFVSNNAVPCGSTIGPITATRLGIPTVDVGVPLLSMHSAREMASRTDLDMFAQALETYLLGI